MQRRAIVGCGVVLALLLGCAAALAMALSGAGSGSGWTAAERYLVDRYHLERELGERASLIAENAARASRRESRRCEGLMKGAPHGAAFGTVNLAILWAPRVAMWRAARSSVAGFARATEGIDWEGQAAGRLASAILREERARTDLAPYEVCRGIVRWRATRYRQLPAGVTVYLKKIAYIDAIGARAVSELGRVPAELKHCIKMRSGRTICSTTTGTAGAGGETQDMQPQGVLLRLLAAAGGPDGSRLATLILALEKRIARIELSAARRGDREITTAIGLDPGVLVLMSAGSQAAG